MDRDARPPSLEPGGGQHKASGIITAPHVLVVEDDVVVRTLLTDILVQERYEVTAVGDGRSALRALKAAPVHALLTDINLPDMDGLDILQQVAADHPKTVGIVMTAYGTVDMAVKAMKAGAVDFITKPFQPDLVTLMLKRVLEVQQLRQENAILKHAVLKQNGIHVRSFSMEEIGHGGEPAPKPPEPAGEDIAVTAAREFQRGVTEGQRLFREQEGGKLATQYEILRRAVQHFEEARRGLAEEMEDQTTELAFQIARRVVHECAEEKRDIVVTQVRAALARLRDGITVHSVIRVRVNPEDLEALEHSRDLLVKSCDLPSTFVFEPDARIGRGGCTVQTGTRLVDATLDSQLARLAEPFKPNRRSA